MTDIPPGSNFWKKCNSCKKEIPYKSRYYVCSVSTCRTKMTGFVFCSVSCWDAHVGFYNHRSAYAEEEFAPQFSETLVPQAAPVQEKKETPVSEEPKKTIVFRAPTSADQVETETLVVTSKVKKLVRDRSGFNSSQCFVDALTRKVVEEALKGIERAKAAGRKTVMGRDLES